MHLIEAHMNSWAAKRPCGVWWIVFYDLMDELRTITAYASFTRRICPAPGRSCSCSCAVSWASILVYGEIWRAAHAHASPAFSIGVSERDQWLSCMSRAMEDVGLEQEVSRSLGKARFTRRPISCATSRNRRSVYLYA